MLKNVTSRHKSFNKRMHPLNHYILDAHKCLYKDLFTESKVFDKPLVYHVYLFFEQIAALAVVLDAIYC